MVEILNAIVNFFKNIGSKIGVDLITLIAFSVTVVVLIVALVVSYFSIEAITNRKIKQINKYLLNNPFVTDENIVEFNRIMKTRIPRSMRYQWQKFMVNRKDKPSQYLSEENCINKPFRNSVFVQMLKQVKYIVGVVAIFSFAFILGAIPTASSSLVEIILRSTTVPMVIAIITFIFLSLMNAKRNSLLNEITYNFDEMQHALDRAVTTFPPFVDYEILFTRKEIVAGIPVLQEYLQQRAEYEQAELERARLSQVEHEQYDFSKLGIKGNLIMDRAMKECEFYLGNRKILLADIDSIQNQKDLITSSFEDKNRGNQRKLRDIKETIERLKEKLNTTTNKIVGNDIIRQQADEIKKQQLVEKEMEEDSNNYNKDIQKLDDQIASKRKEIEENKKLVEATLINDFKDYSDKIYEELKKIADSHVFEEIDKLKTEKDKLEHELEDREQYIIQKNALYEEKVKENDSYKDIKLVVEQLKKDIIVKDQEIIGANKENESRAKENKMLRTELERIKKDKYHEVYRYFDMDGVEFFYDENGEPYYYDNAGKMEYYQDAEKIKKLKSYKHRENGGNEGDSPAVLTENVEPSQPAPSEVVEQSATQTETLPQETLTQQQPAPVENTEPQVQNFDLTNEEIDALDTLGKEGLGLTSDEIASLNALGSEEINDQPEQEVEQGNIQPQQNVEPQNVASEEPSQTEPEKEPEEQYIILQPADDEETSEVESNEQQLNSQIEEQNKILEQHHEELREQISQAVKAIEAYKDEIATSKEEKPKKSTTKKAGTKKKTSTKKATTKKKTATKKSVAKKPTTKKTTTKKSTTKKSATKKATTKKTEPKVKSTMEENKEKSTTQKSTKPNKKKGYVFKVKKAPKGIELEGFDLSGFNELFGEEAKQSVQNKETDNGKDSK